MPRQLLQLKGDPSIRRFVFSQTRAESLFDRRYSELMDRIEELFLFYGVFHVQIHMSTSQVTVWLLDDPFNYRVLPGDEIFDVGNLQRLPIMSYSDQAKISIKQIRPLLERFRELRFSDETVYLRSGSINVMNGSLGLNFSCDGTHYVDHEEFLVSSLYEV